MGPNPDDTAFPKLPTGRRTAEERTDDKPGDRSPETPAEGMGARGARRYYGEGRRSGGSCYSSFRATHQPDRPDCSFPEWLASFFFFFSPITPDGKGNGLRGGGGAPRTNTPYPLDLHGQGSSRSSARAKWPSHLHATRHLFPANFFYRVFLVIVNLDIFRWS